MITKHIAVSGDHDHAASDTAPRFFHRSKVLSHIGVGQEGQNTGGAGHNTDRRGQPWNLLWGNRGAISDDQFNAPVTAGSGGDNREGVLFRAHQVGISQGAKRSRDCCLVSLLDPERI